MSRRERSTILIHTQVSVCTFPHKDRTGCNTSQVLPGEHYSLI